LPEIYQTDPVIDRFLLGFEKVLLGRQDDVAFCYKDGSLVDESTKDNPDICYYGLEETIAGLATLFDPQQTPEKFLSWLASWTALSLRADLPSSVQRSFIADIIQLYRFRGTKENLQKLLGIFIKGSPTITEIGVHIFRVTILLPKELQDKPKDLARQLEIARSLIELEKPAHTDYELIQIFQSTMQIPVRVGVDTLLGTIPEN
jgi:phage tail-like protein